jgi:2-polyprenyl-3-methyl-5-hydroxy-6-metoxy-1,4-benzoquinol methylase
MTSKTLLVENLLARPEMHRQWEQDYRNADNENFYERAFDFIIDVVKPAAGATFLDAGCGSCAHSVRLARRGFQVHAVDFSESALSMAREYARSKGLADRISLGRESLLQLSFADNSFDYVLCWGVLMHIPEVEQAVAELARVVRPGGSLVISEANCFSVEALSVRYLRRILGREKADVKVASAGVEYWKDKDGDALVTREANIDWLISELETRGLKLTARAAGQFSESYTRFSAPALKGVVHKLNKFWFEQIKSARPAFGNILVFKK